MCGIFAVFGLSEGSDRWRATALRLSKLLRHRGPDWNGIACFRSAILAHERLSVVGVTSGAQPIASADGAACLSVNGEIYNYRELKEALLAEAGGRGGEERIHFSTDSDCEILLHLFRLRGTDFLENEDVCGMFAFAVYDEREDVFVVARDHVGIIPLYMGWGKDGSTWFASELKALQTECDHYEIFPPGHYYQGRSNHSEKGEMKPFYRHSWFVDQNFFPSTPVDLVEFRRQLTSSVRRHLLSEVPYGLLLSGGLDSSLVASVACREYARLGNADHLRSFCIGLDGSPDIAAAEKVADHIGTRHYSFTFTVQQGLDVLSDVIYHLETFDVTTVRASTPMFLLARRVKATGCKMVLSGEGADEVFGGYLYFHRAPDKEEFHRETVRKVRDLHRFDCLRANKSMMAWGVEARVPFLDRHFLEYAMTLDPAAKMCGRNAIEKRILREAFDDQEDPYLPKEVLWRQKEQFSDGVGYGWIDGLRDHAESAVTDLQMRFASNRFSVSPPQTKEGYLYREIFSKHFPSPSAARTVPAGKSIACSTEAALRWDEAFSSSADPSGRSVAGVHVDAYATPEADTR